MSEGSVQLNSSPWLCSTTTYPSPIKRTDEQEASRRQSTSSNRRNMTSCWWWTSISNRCDAQDDPDRIATLNHRILNLSTRRAPTTYHPAAHSTPCCSHRATPKIRRFCCWMYRWHAPRQNHIGFNIGQCGERIKEEGNQMIRCFGIPDGIHRNVPECPWRLDGYLSAANCLCLHSLWMNYCDLNHAK